MKHVKTMIAWILAICLGVEPFGQTSMVYAAPGLRTTREYIDDMIPLTEEIDKEADRLSEEKIFPEEMHSFEKQGLIGELEELRDERSKQFYLSDGTVAAVGYDTDVHYLDEKENWCSIDNRLVSGEITSVLPDHEETDSLREALLQMIKLRESGLETVSGEASIEESFYADILRSLEMMENGSSSVTKGYTNKAGRVSFSFVSDPKAPSAVCIRQGNYILSFTPLNGDHAAKEAEILPMNDSIAPKDGSVVSHMEVPNIRSGIHYSKLFEGTDVDYIAEGSNLKECMILQSPMKSYQYSYHIHTDGLTIRKSEDHTISFYADDTGKLLYTIPAMVMWDAAGETSGAVKCELIQSEKDAVLMITADPEWINAPERVFPVTIDPTLESSSTATGADARIVRNQYVCSGRPTAAAAGYGNGYLGYDSAGEKIYRLFVQFKTLPAIPSSSVICGAKFYYAQRSYENVAMPDLTVTAKEVTENWTWGTSLNWNTQPSFSNTVLDYRKLSASSTGTYVGWDITKLIKRHYEERDNSTNETSSFVLTGWDETYSSAHCAKATVIQENSAGYFSSAQPLLLISYRNTTGLEDYYTGQSMSMGRAGTAAIRDYAKELTVDRTDLYTTGTVLPFSIRHVYNSDFGDQYFTSSAGLQTKNFSNMKIGMGWKLNIQETVIEKTIGTKTYAVYCDEDGTEHYFEKEASGNIYKDEDGLKLTITKDTNPLRYILTDEKGNSKVFHNGFLSTIRDANGNQIFLLYNGSEYSASGAWYANTGNTNKITKVVRLNNGQSTPQTIATLDYGTTAFLHRITDAYGRTTIFSFTAGTDASGAARGYNLTGITDPDGIHSDYYYYLINTHRVNKLARVKDGETALGGRFTYHVTNHSSRLSAYESVHWNGNSYAIDRSVKIGNPSPHQTVYQDPGVDGINNTRDDLKTIVTFDNAGRTLSEVTTDRTSQILYGASASAYSRASSSESGSGQPNRLLSDVVTGTHGVNLLPNGFGEKGGSYNSTVSLLAGKTYTFSAFYKNTDTSAFTNDSYICLEVRNGSGTILARSPVLNSATSNMIDDGWTRLEVSVTPAANGTYTLAAYTRNVTGPGIFRDIQLEEGEAASDYNLLTNGDLEWNGGWTFSSGASRITGGIHGTYGIRIIGDSTSTRYAAFEIPLNCSSDTTFLLSGWGRADSVPELIKDNVGERFFGLEVILTYSDNTTESHTVSFDNGTGGDQYAAGNIVPKRSNTTIDRATVRCVYGKNVNTAVFDNISFRKEPVACYKYDSEGNVIAVNSKGNAALNFNYQAGDLIRETDTANGTYQYEYDSRHNLTKATNDNVALLLTYDAKGHVTAANVQTADGSGKKIRTSAAYSPDGNYQTSQTDASGNSTIFGTNSHGLTGSVTDAAGNTISYQYDSSNDRLEEVNLSVDNQTGIQYTYSQGMLSQIIRSSLLPDGITECEQTYSFSYDIYGNVTAVSVGNRQLAAYAYLPKNGPLSQITYGNGNTISYTYDDLWQIRTESRNGELRYRYRYNSEGELSGKDEIDTDGLVIRTTVFEYDSLGRLIRSCEEELRDGEMIRTVGTEHLYDTSDRLTKQSWKTENGGTRSETYTYNNSDGTLRRMKTASGRNLTLTYDSLKRLSGKSDGARQVEYRYVDVGASGTTTQISEMNWSRADTGAPGISYGYTYDVLGNILSIDKNGSREGTYTYDGQSQLVTENLPQEHLSYQYRYDTAGNIRSVMETDRTDPAAPVSTTHNYSYADGAWKDLMTAYDGHAITYDAIGNPLSYYNGTDWSFTWQNGRQLVGAVSSEHTIEYNYDGEGLRTSKTVDGIRHDYVYLGNHLIEERWNNKLLQFAYDERNRPYSVKYTDGTAEFLYFYILNQQGDVVRVESGSGTAVAEYTYNAWGKVLHKTGFFASINPILYRGYYYDNTTGLYYVGNRYYDSQLSRFICPDDTGVLKSNRILYDKNLYSYCDNNPVSRKDEDGESWIAACTIGACMALIGQYISDVCDNIVSGATGIDVFVPTSSKKEYLAAAVGGFIAAIPGLNAVGTAFVGAVGNIASDGINGTLSSPKDWVISAGKGASANMAGYIASKGMGYLEIKKIEKMPRTIKKKAINNLYKGTQSMINVNKRKFISSSTAAKLSILEKNHWVLRSGIYSSTVSTFTGLLER